MSKVRTIKLVNERKCLKCGSLQTYVLKNGTRVCRVCGFRRKPEEEIKGETENA